MLTRVFATNAPAAVVLIRLMVGVVFASEGIQKFLLPDQLGIGRFTRIGIPFPEIMAPFVGAVEIVCGVLILLGCSTHVAALPLLINISVTSLSTKVPILLGHGFWGFQLPKLESYGWWSMLPRIVKMLLSNCSFDRGGLLVAWVEPFDCWREGTKRRLAGC